LNTNKSSARYAYIIFFQFPKVAVPLGHNSVSPVIISQKTISLMIKNRKT